MNILEFDDVHISYGNEKEAVKGVSFFVPKGKIVAVVGESGSGKSTMIRAAIDLLPGDGHVTGGNIIFLGQNIHELSEKEKREMRGSKMAMIFQDAGSYLNPRVKIGKQYLETLNAHLNPGISKKDKEKIACDTLKKLKLSDAERIMNSYPFQLSGGQRQRVAIAMAISMKPKLLLADEPTSALDVTIQAQVVKELLALREELDTSVLLVTHNMGVASRSADYIAVMKDGELMEFGTRDKIIFHPENEYTKALLEAVPKLESEESIKIHKEEHRKKYQMIHGESK